MIYRGLPRALSTHDPAGAGEIYQLAMGSWGWRRGAGQRLETTGSRGLTGSSTDLLHHLGDELRRRHDLALVLHVLIIGVRVPAPASGWG